MEEATQPTRRERYRADTQAEIKERALRQLREGGPEALSLNAIAKEMGMSGPALYRYFANRDVLIDQLVVDAWEDLAAAFEAAAEGARRRSARTRLTMVARAYREWGLANPHRYSLLFSSRPPGHESAEAEIAPSVRCMLVILDALGAVAGRAPGSGGRRSDFDRKLEAWGANRGMPDLPPAILKLGVNAWTRMHGVVSIELLGHIDAMGLDPALVFDAEIEALANAAEAAGQG